MENEPLTLDGLEPAVAHIAQTMLGAHLAPSAPHDDCETWMCLPIVGEAAGALWVGFPAGSGAMIFRAMCGEDAQDASESAEACGEFTNWVAGWVKTRFTQSTVGLPQLDEPAPPDAQRYGFDGDFQVTVAVLVFG